MMLDKVDNITLSLDLDSVENKDDHQCLTLISVCPDSRPFHKTYNHLREETKRHRRMELYTLRAVLS